MKLTRHLSLDDNLNSYSKPSKPQAPTLHDGSGAGLGCRCQLRQRKWAKTGKKFL